MSTLPVLLATCNAVVPDVGSDSLMFTPVMSNCDTCSLSPFRPERGWLCARIAPIWRVRFKQKDNARVGTCAEVSYRSAGEEAGYGKHTDLELVFLLISAPRFRSGTEARICAGDRAQTE